MLLHERWCEKAVAQLANRKSVTIRDVAERAGVSIATVSYVLSGKKRISSTTVEKVLKAAEDLGYVPNKVARSLKEATTQIIGVLVPDIRNPFFPDVVDALSEALSEKGYQIIVASSDEDPRKQKEIIHSFLEYRVAGIIAIPTGSSSSVVKDFEKLCFTTSTVLLDRSVDVPCPKVVLDNRKAAEDITRFILDRGHSRIGLIAPPLHLSIGLERFEGYAKALRDRGINLDPALVYEGNLFAESGRRAFAYFMSMEKDRRPTAILSCSDVMTLGVLREIRKRGLKIPEDISIASFDNPDYFELLNPPLTCIAQPTIALGKKAAELMTEALKGRKMAGVYKYKGKLVVRESV